MKSVEQLTAEVEAATKASRDADLVLEEASRALRHRECQEKPVLCGDGHLHDWSFDTVDVHVKYNGTGWTSWMCEQKATGVYHCRRGGCDAEMKVTQTNRVF